jgi:hypothetical protein
MGGTRVIISIENLDPITVKALKRKRSPKTNPTNPESESHIQFSALASVGKTSFLRIKVKVLRKIKPTISLRKLTGKDPDFRLADSNARADIVQKKATSNAANSPR